jgi:hypothetical protein
MFVDNTSKTTVFKKAYSEDFQENSGEHQAKPLDGLCAWLEIPSFRI